MNELVETLRQQQELVIEQLFRVNENEYNKQYHPDLSPLGWHLGHCVYTETYWLREAWLNREICPDDLKSLYIPELCKKILRSKRLPAFNELLSWATHTQKENIELINRFNGSHSDHELMQNNFLLYFLIQHYAQHYETMQMILHVRALENSQQYSVKNKLESKTLKRDSIQIPEGHYEIGTTSNTIFYDNEIPGHSVWLDNFSIAKDTVTNAEYLAFMEQGAYEDRQFWSNQGWQWHNLQKIDRPFLWFMDDSGHNYAVDDKGPHDLISEDPVTGINYYEASAFASWAKARLPHEYEWEAALKNNKMENTGSAWQWCGNTFHAYTGFKAFPYEGYSTPYFDERHYTLKGSSTHTQNIIKRPSFRNYYQADKRHIFAGIRLIFQD